MRKTAHAHTAHGGVIHVMKRIVGRYHMTGTLRQGDGDPVLIHISHGEITRHKVIELTEVEC